MYSLVFPMTNSMTVLIKLVFSECQYQLTLKVKYTLILQNASPILMDFTSLLDVLYHNSFIKIWGKWVPAGIQRHADFKYL